MLCRSFHRCKKQNQIPQAIAAQALYGIKMQMSKLKTYFLQRRDCFILMCSLSVFLSSILFSALTAVQSKEPPNEHACRNDRFVHVNLSRQRLAHEWPS